MWRGFSVNSSWPSRKLRYPPRQMRKWWTCFSSQTPGPIFLIYSAKHNIGYFLVSCFLFPCNFYGVLTAVNNPNLNFKSIDCKTIDEYKFDRHILHTKNTKCWMIQTFQCFQHLQIGAAPSHVALLGNLFLFIRDLISEFVSLSGNFCIQIRERRRCLTT